MICVGWWWWRWRWWWWWWRWWWWWWWWRRCSYDHQLAVLCGRRRLPLMNLCKLLIGRMAEGRGFEFMRKEAWEGERGFERERENLRRTKKERISKKESWFEKDQSNSRFSLQSCVAIAISIIFAKQCNWLASAWITGWKRVILLSISIAFPLTIEDINFFQSVAIDWLL